MNERHDCRHLLESLSDYIDGELDEILCVELERHLSECDNCRIVVDTLQKTIDLYHHEPVPEPLPPDIRERLFRRLDLDDFKK